MVLSGTCTQSRGKPSPKHDLRAARHVNCLSHRIMAKTEWVIFRKRQPACIFVQFQGTLAATGQFGLGEERIEYKLAPLRQTHMGSG